MTPLTKISPGRYRIVKIATPGQSSYKRFMMLGIFEGDEVEVIKSSPGPVILEKGGTRIGIGQGMASSILVEKITDDKGS